jgi:hypothetical protein
VFGTGERKDSISWSSSLPKWKIRTSVDFWYWSGFEIFWLTSVRGDEYFFYTILRVCGVSIFLT